MLTLVMFRIADPLLRTVSGRSVVVFAATTPKSIVAGASIAGRLAPLDPTLARIIALADVVPEGGPIARNCVPLFSDKKLRFCATLLESSGNPTPWSGVGATNPM